MTFARFKQAVEAVEARVAAGELPRAPDGGHGWCFIVATLDRDGYFSGKPWLDVTAAYKALGGMSRKLLERIGREWGPDVKLERSGRSKQLRTVRKLGNRWVSVVEAHRSGWPHVNLVFWCPELAALLRAESAARLEDPEIANAVALARDAWKRREAIPGAVREMARQATVAGGRVLDILEASGWGRQSTAEAARDIEAVIGYGVKLAGLHDASVGELAKVTQCPMNAPERFRRLRSGKGFLPPRQKDETVTGCMMRRRRSAEGDWELQAINAPKDERQHPQIERARCAELQLIDEEERLLSSSRGKLPAMPPLRRARLGVLEGHRETSERRHAMQAREMAAAG